MVGKHHNSSQHVLLLKAPCQVAAMEELIDAISWKRNGNCKAGENDQRAGPCEKPQLLRHGEAAAEIDAENCGCDEDNTPAKGEQRILGPRGGSDRDATRIRIHFTLFTPSTPSSSGWR